MNTETNEKQEEISVGLRLIGWVIGIPCALAIAVAPALLFLYFAYVMFQVFSGS